MNTLTKSLIRTYDQFIDRKMNKVNRVNNPLKTVKKSEDYSKFKMMFKDGIQDQLQWVSDNMARLFKSAGIEDNMQPLAYDQKMKLKGLISRDMPSLDSFVTEFKVFQSLKTFYEMSAKAQYKQWGYMVKADKVDFTLTNPQYIAKLKDRANYLLQKSSLDQTTTDQVIDMIDSGREDMMTIQELSTQMSDDQSLADIGDYRAEMIARTESANAVGSANYDVAVENGSPTHSWVVAGPGCDDCDQNEADGDIPIDQEFSTGDLAEPAHPNCECYTEPGEIDLSAIDVWGGE